MVAEQTMLAVPGVGPEYIQRLWLPKTPYALRRLRLHTFSDSLVMESVAVWQVVSGS